MSTDPDRAPRTAAPEPHSAAAARRVLVVDDEDLVRAVIARKLRHSGFDVLEARDGLEALASIRVEPPDAVLTDLNMPRCNGERLCLELKRDRATACIPVLLMTGGPIDEDRMRAAGMAGVVYKPLPDALGDIVAAAITAKPAQAACLDV